MPDYRKYPPDRPGHKGLWVLVAVLVVMLLANLVDKSL
jgi:hypothetical protein